MSTCCVIETTAATINNINTNTNTTITAPRSPEDGHRVTYQ